MISLRPTRPATAGRNDFELILEEALAPGGTPAVAAGDESGVAVRLAISDPRLLELPPRAAVEAQLRLLSSYGGFETAAFWLRPPTERLRRVAAIGAAGSRDERRAARRAVEENGPVVVAGFAAVPVLCWDVPHGAVVVSAPAEADTLGNALLHAAGRAAAAVVERDMLLERSAGRERSLLDAAERRLLRAGLDIHDGPVQGLAAASIDLALLREQMGALARDPASSALARGRLDDLRAALGAVQDELRDIAQLLEMGSAPVTRVVESVKRDATRLAERFGFDVEVEVSGTFERLSSSQRICVVRVVHEALVNVGEHSAATSARVSLSNERGATVVRVVDDGKGFQVEGTLVRAAKRGRLGLVGMSERARLLGGTLDVRSAVGGPTEIRLVLPEWQPLDESASAESGVAAALPDLLADRAARRPHAR